MTRLLPEKKQELRLKNGKNPMSPDSQDSGPGEAGPERSQLVPPDDFSALYDAWLAGIRRTTDTLDGWALVGIKRRGAVLARRLLEDLGASRGGIPSYGELDISLYRDDYHLQTGAPEVLGTEISFAVEDKSIVLVDDVLYTGRTIRAALDLVLDFGRPKRIWLAVLVDRGNRELPIEADFTGQAFDTQKNDRVQVRLVEMGDDYDGVDLTSFVESGA